MEKRGFVVAVVLILGIAMFASFVSDKNYISGKAMQPYGEGSGFTSDVNRKSKVKVGVCHGCLECETFNPPPPPPYEIHQVWGCEKCKVDSSCTVLYKKEDPFVEFDIRYGACKFKDPKMECCTVDDCKKLYPNVTNKMFCDSNTIVPGCKCYELIPIPPVQK